MERLTDKAWKNLDPWEMCGQDHFCGRGCHDIGGCNGGCIVPKLYKKLARYEDAEESGLLVRLPCKVGDTVYWVPDLSGDIILTDTISAICLYRGNRLRVVLPKVDIEPIYPNAHLFLTREEAEKALEAKR